MDWKRIGSIGRVQPRKGFGVLIKAMPKVVGTHPNTRLVIAGSDPDGYRLELEELAYGLGVYDNVEFLGFVKDVRGFLSSLDIFAMASVGEGLGLVVLEAMAMGCPIVVSDIPAFREIVPWYQRLTGPNEWGERLCMALKWTDGFRERKGMALRQHVKDNFSVEVMKRKHEQVYESL